MLKFRYNINEIAKNLKPYFIIYKIGIFRNPSLTLTVFHPGGLLKLAKVKFTMSCLSDAQKLEITKDLKPLA